MFISDVVIPSTVHVRRSNRHYSYVSSTHSHITSIAYVYDIGSTYSSITSSSYVYDTINRLYLVLPMTDVVSIIYNIDNHY